MAKKPAPHEPYSKLPHFIQTSPAYVGASAAARALLLDVIYFERGFNNGSLLVTISKFRPIGWTSHQKFYRALDELVQRGLLMRTTEARTGVAALYALSWMATMKSPIDRQAKRKGRSSTKTFPETGKGQANTFPETGTVAFPNRERLLTRNGKGTPSALPESGKENAKNEAQPFPIRVTDACCQGGEEKNGFAGGASRVPGEGQPMTIYVAESNGAFSLAVRPTIQRESTILCTDAREPDIVMAATRRALAIATQHKAVLRLVGTTEALAAFDPILVAAKASEGAKS